MGITGPMTSVSGSSDKPASAGITGPMQGNIQYNPKPQQINQPITPTAPTVSPIRITSDQKKIDLGQIGNNLISAVKQNAPLIVKGLSFAISAAQNPGAAIGSAIGNSIRDNQPVKYPTQVQPTEQPKIQAPVINKRSVVDSFKKTFSMTPVGTTISTAARVPDVIKGLVGAYRGDPGTFPEARPIPAKNPLGFVAKNGDQALGIVAYQFLKDLTSFNNAGAGTTIEQGAGLLKESIKGSGAIAPKVAFVQEAVSKFTSKEFNSLLNKLSPIKFTIQDLRDVQGVAGAKPTIEQTVKFQKVTQLADQMGISIKDLLTPAEKMGASPKTTIFDFIKNSIDDITKSLKSTLSPEEQKLLGSGVKSDVEKIITPGEYTSQEILGKVISNGLEKTPEGKQLIKLANSAQANGQSIMVDSVANIAKSDISLPTDIKASIGKPMQVVSTDELITHVGRMGYRTPEQIQTLKKVIEDNGITYPVELIINEDGSFDINDGNHRIQIAKDMGIKELPVKIVENRQVGNLAQESISGQPPKTNSPPKTEVQTNSPQIPAKEVVPAPPENVTPSQAQKVVSPTDKFQSRVFERLKADHPQLEGSLAYDPIKLQDQTKKAVDLIAKDKQKAFDIAMGKETSDEMTSTAVNIALAEKALDEGNNDLYAKLITNRSLAQTRRGQELVSERGSLDDNSTSRYVKELISSRLDKLGKTYLKGLREGKVTDKEHATQVIDREVAKIEKNIKNNKLDVKTAISLLEELKCI